MFNFQNLLLLFLFIFFYCSGVFAQQKDNATIRNYIEQFKTDPRGPYKEIRWFCKDGSILPPKERCLEPGGVQRARYKDDVEALAITNHIYLGQILTTTPFQDFWDETNFNSRLKQYQFEKYLSAVDNGWILRRAQFYRGAYQAEDEESWGINFYEWLLEKDDIISKQYFLIRESIKDIPHQGDNNIVQNIRAVSKYISDEYSPFMDLRIKIHGQPDATDLTKVKNFKENNKSKLNLDLLKKFDELIADMEVVYRPADLNSLEKYLKNLPNNSALKVSITAFIKNHSPSSSIKEKISDAIDLMWLIRKNLLGEKKPKARLALLDVSINLEEIIFREIDNWESLTVKDLLLKNYYLCKALASTGYIEIWEWEYVERMLYRPNSEVINLGELNTIVEYGRRIVEWGTGMARSNYEDVINLYAGFEPLAYGFLDDRIRSSLLLPLGKVVGRLNKFVSTQSSFSNMIMDIEDKGSVRGLNPGFAMGELVVISDSPEEREFSADKIYIFDRPPADLKPVAGIATVTEGNIVSHVQLLARNLGIPNAVVSPEILKQLKNYSGTKVFYAVSRERTVILKPAAHMTSTEKKLFENKERSDDRVKVPVDKLELTVTKIVNLRNLRAINSGKLCGPKAANLGELKYLFPDNVVEGFVIPFGIFREHMDQLMPGSKESYWQFLNRIFYETAEMQKLNVKQAEIDAFTLQKLDELRTAIQSIYLLPGFVNNLEESFINILNMPMGSIPVFIRSDTNMEDLKDFTGAGLNLTIFNVLEEEKILQGIRDVWASPYSERSYKWRQKFLINPENVFPSLLIIPTVNVEKSGVMITKGITSGDDDDITVAFSKGAGGAVEGQLAETYLLNKNGDNILLFPSRESRYILLPDTGGSTKGITYFQTRILKQKDLDTLRVLSSEIKSKINSTHNRSSIEPLDIELGFKDSKIWLFQIRPFVENKNAAKSEYLESITPDFPANKKIDLKQKI